MYAMQQQHKLTFVICLGIEVFSSGIGDLYYPSNDMDPYLKDKNVSSSTCCHFISVAVKARVFLLSYVVYDASG